MTGTRYIVDHEREHRPAQDKRRWRFFVGFRLRKHTYIRWFQSIEDGIAYVVEINAELTAHGEDRSQVTP